MAAEVAVRAALVAGLRGDAVLMAGLNGLFDGAPARAAAPYGMVGEAVGSAWGAKDVEGRELVVTVAFHEAGETPGRIGDWLERVGVVMAGLAPEGWRPVGAQLLRSRIGRGAGRDGWEGVVDYRVRVVRGA